MAEKTSKDDLVVTAESYGPWSRGDRLSRQDLAERGAPDTWIDSLIERGHLAPYDERDAAERDADAGTTVAEALRGENPPTLPLGTDGMVKSDADREALADPTTTPVSGPLPEGPTRAERAAAADFQVRADDAKAAAAQAQAEADRHEAALKDAKKAK